MIRILLLCLLLAACQPAAPDPNPLNLTATAQADATTIAAASTALASLPTAETPAAQAATVTPCAFMWATRPQLELTTRVNQALLDAGLRGVEASASSYGETCGAAFLAMDTSFDFFIPVEAVNGDEALGTLAGQIIEMVRAIPMDERPAPNRGYLTFIMVGVNEERSVRVREDAALAAAEANPAGGAALLSALEAAAG